MKKSVHLGFLVKHPIFEKYVSVKHSSIINYKTSTVSEWLDLLCLAPKGRVRASERIIRSKIFFIRMTFLRNRSIGKNRMDLPKTENLHTKIMITYGWYWHWYCIRNRPSDLWYPIHEIHKSMKIWSEWVSNSVTSFNLKSNETPNTTWIHSLAMVLFPFMFSHKIMRNPKAWQMSCLSLNSQYSTRYTIRIQLLLLNTDWTIFGGIDLFLFNQCISSFPSFHSPGMDLHYNTSEKVQSTSEPL